MEKWALDAAFQEAYRQDPDRTLAETGLDVDSETIRLLLAPSEEDSKTVKAVQDRELSPEVLPTSFRLYKAFIKEKIDMRDNLRKEEWLRTSPTSRSGGRGRKSDSCWSSARTRSP